MPVFRDTEHLYEVLGALKAPPRRVAGVDVPIPYNRALENAALPDVEDVVRTVREMTQDG